MSRTTTAFVSLTAASFTLLAGGCAAAADQPEPITKAEQVTQEAKDYVGDPWEQRCRNLYFSDRAMSDVWQRHPELIGRAR